MPRVALINPNTSRPTTAAMVAIAQAANADLHIVGLTAGFGAPLITNGAELAVARDAVIALGADLATGYAAAIVSAFGDPGLADLRQSLPIAVAGIGEAGMLEAARDGRRFAVVTTTPGLAPAMQGVADRLGLAAACAGIVLTDGDPAAVTGDPVRLEAALATAIERAIAKLRVEAVVIGGGPLAVAARALAPRYLVPIIEPIPAAVRWIDRALATTR